MKPFLIITVALLVLSCHSATQKAKETINKAGEVAGKAGSEFAEGVAKGVEKTFSNEVVFSDELTQKGVSAGKIIISSSDSATDNLLSVYLIFAENFEGIITVKVFSPEGKEYGRIRLSVQGAKNEARYFDFLFDKRTNIDSKGKLIFE